ncbi:MAG TPA: hypothetical protein VF803_02795 [Candidatus Paceibacterota bacterium]
MNNTNNALATALQSAGATNDWPYKLVVHQHPDTDAILCLWAVQRFALPKGADYQIVFVNAGDGLSEAEKIGYNVIEMDTGRGELDQHGRHLKRGSSFKLVCQKYGISHDPALTPLIELADATDNVEKISLTDVHYLFKGRRSKCKTEDHWGAFVYLAFNDLDTLYDQYSAWARADREFGKNGDIKTLGNGIKISFILGRPNLRDAAYRAGADVVVWSESRPGDKYHIGIQTSRDSTVSLRSLARSIRIAEAQMRGIDIAGLDLGASDVPKIPGWRLHESGNLLTCGTKGHPLEGDQFSKLSAGVIRQTVERTLGNTKVRPAAKK